MALQVWLPLNGDTKNYGCSSVNGVYTQPSGFSYENGKIGKCLRIANGGSNALTYSGLVGLTTWSICCWMKLSSSDPTPSYQDMFSLGIDNNGAISGAGFRFEHRNISGTLQIVTTKLTTYGSTTNSYYIFYGDNINLSNLWAHVVVTNDGTNYKTYVNGILKNTTAINLFTATTSKLTGELSLGQANTYCWLNDIRVYDEALSEKEIKEISKALIVHYPMNDQYNSTTLNKYSSTAAGGLAGGSWTVTKLANESGYNYKGTKTGDGNNSWWSFGFPHFTFTVGKRYFYSLKCRCNKFTNASLTLKAARSDNDWVTNGINICSSALADGQWHEYYVSQIVNETYDRSGSTVTCNPRLEAYTSNMNGNGTVYEMNFDIKDVQVIESDTYIPFIENDYASTKVHDTSGFGNHGTVVGNVSVTNDTPRYNIATLFQKAGYIDNPNFKMDLYAFTLTFWINVQAISSQHFLFGTFDSWTYNGIGIWRDNASYTKYNFLVKSNSSSGYAHKLITVSAANTWNFIAIVYTGTTYKGYLNNVLQFSDTYGDSGYIINKNLMVGNSKYNSTPASENEECKLSDLRLYATALSDADILELYQKPVSITQHSMMTQGEFVEG